ncbi:MAG: ferredoxin [Patescibacteria group bacterium]
MNVKVNQDQCIGCGACVTTCPEVFELTAEGKSQAKAGVDYAKYSDKIRQAIQDCPVDAISMEE